MIPSLEDVGRRSEATSSALYRGRRSFRSRISKMRRREKRVKFVRGTCINESKKEKGERAACFDVIKMR